MRTIARRHPMAVFLAIAYGIGALAFALPLASSAGLGIIDLELPGAAPFVLLAAIGLAVAAFITTALADGRDGVRDLRRRVFRFRVHPAWYVLALFILPASAVATATVIGGPSVLVGLVTHPEIVLGVVIAGSVLAFLLVNWWEEVAWTGFALERLQPRIGPMAASVVTTWLQALIHLPLVFVADGVTVGRVPVEQIPVFLVALFVLPIPVRILLTWVYNASNKSLPIAGLYHAGLGVATGAAFIPVLAPELAPIWVYAGFAVLALGLVLVTRGRLGYQPQQPVAQVSHEVVAAA